MTMTKSKTRIPAFGSIKEEADFWDTHDTTDFEGEFKPAKVVVARKLEHVLAVRFDGQTLAELQERASRKGIGPTTLIRMWVREHLSA
jgi:predicted DNA binding CopG/RHH family protein